MARKLVAPAISATKHHDIIGTFMGVTLRPRALDDNNRRATVLAVGAGITLILSAFLITGWLAFATPLAALLLLLGKNSVLTSRRLRTTSQFSGYLHDYERDVFTLYKLHNEVHAYLRANRTSDLHREHFNELSLMANKVYLSILTKKLQPREDAVVVKKAGRAAANLHRDLDQLYKDMLFQAEHDPTGNCYGELLQELEGLREPQQEATATYRELNRTYQDYVLRDQPSQTYVPGRPGELPELR